MHPAVALHTRTSCSAHTSPQPCSSQAPAVPVSDAVVHSQDDHCGCPVPEEAHGEEHDVAVVSLIPHWASPWLEQHNPNLGGMRTLLAWGKICPETRVWAGLQMASSLPNLPRYSGGTRSCYRSSEAYSCPSALQTPNLESWNHRTMEP